MRLTHNDLDRGFERGERREKPEDRKNEFGFFKKATEYIGTTARVVAVAVGMTVFAYGCGSNQRFTGDAENEEEIPDADAETESDVPDIPDADVDSIEDADAVEEDTIEEDASVDDVVEEDVAVDDVVEDDVATDDVVEEDVVEEEVPPVPTCFTIPAPIDPSTDALLNNSNSQDATFNSTGTETISADLATNASMTGYPSVVLGVCPDDPDAVAFVANAGDSISFMADVSMEAGASSWSAIVPLLPGALCPALAPDSATLVAKNGTHQQVPKNADMGGTMTHAGFDLMPVTSTLVSYEKDGVSSIDGTLTITGSNFSAPNTIRSFVLDGSVDVNVEVRAGDSNATHVYTAIVTGVSSKEARVYATNGDQMYGVTWTPENTVWCSRCVGNETFDLVLTGDLLCKIADTCGCVGDGFDINILGATIDPMRIPPHLRGLHTVSTPLVSSSVSATALSDPATAHPSINVRLVKGSVAWDGGEVVNMDVTVNAELISQHQNPDGSYDTRTVSVIVRVVDPWCWGSLEPTYSSTCGCTPIYD